MMCSSLHCMQKGYSAYLTNALSCGVVLTADLIYCSIVKKPKKPKTITDSVTSSQLSLSWRKGLFTKKAANCKSSCWLLLLCSNLIMWSIISAVMAPHFQAWKGIPQRISIKMLYMSMYAVLHEKEKNLKHIYNNVSSHSFPLNRP